MGGLFRSCTTGPLLGGRTWGVSTHVGEVLGRRLKLQS